MRSRAVRLPLLIVLGLGAVGAATAGVAALTQGDQEPHRSAVPSAGPSPTRNSPAIEDIGAPTRLRIGSIGVDAPVIEVGTTKDNAQDVPRSLTDTGWWRDGQRPGQPGNAVMVGHTASRSDGVFDRLGEIAKGDTVVVMSENGSVTYTVTAIDEIAVADFETVASDVYRRTGPSGVVLMTCGDFDGTQFNTTVIVYAEAREG